MLRRIFLGIILAGMRDTATGLQSASSRDTLQAGIIVRRAYHMGGIFRGNVALFLESESDSERSTRFFAGIENITLSRE